MQVRSLRVGSRRSDRPNLPITRLTVMISMTSNNHQNQPIDRENPLHPAACLGLLAGVSKRVDGSVNVLRKPQNYAPSTWLQRVLLWTLRRSNTKIGTRTVSTSNTQSNCLVNKSHCLSLGSGSKPSPQIK